MEDSRMEAEDYEEEEMQFMSPNASYEGSFEPFQYNSNYMPDEEENSRFYNYMGRSIDNVANMEVSQEDEGQEQQQVILNDELAMKHRQEAISVLRLETKQFILTKENEFICTKDLSEKMNKLQQSVSTIQKKLNRESIKLGDMENAHNIEMLELNHLNEQLDHTLEISETIAEFVEEQKQQFEALNKKSLKETIRAQNLQLLNMETKYKSLIDQKREQIKLLKPQCADLNNIFLTASNDSILMKEDKLEIERSLNDISKSINELSSSNNAGYEEINKLRETERQNINTIRDLLATSKDLKSILASKTEICKNIEHEYDSKKQILTGRLEEIKTRKEKQDEEIRFLTSSIEEDEKMRDHLERELQSTTELFGNIKASLNNKLSNNSAEVDNMKSRKDEVNGLLQKIKKEFDLAVTKLDEQNQLNQNLKQKLSFLNEEKKFFEKRVLETKLSNKNNEITLLSQKHENSLKVEKVGNLKTQHDSLLNSCEILKTKLIYETKEFDSLMATKLEALENKILDKEKQINTNTKKIDYKKSSCEYLKEKKKELNKQLEKVSNQLVDYHVQVEQLRTDIKNQSDKVEILQKAHNDLKNELENQVGGNQVLLTRKTTFESKTNEETLDETIADKEQEVEPLGILKSPGQSSAAAKKVTFHGVPSSFDSESTDDWYNKFFSNKKHCSESVNIQQNKEFSD